jgi:UDP-glucose 4-epimerase
MISGVEAWSIRSLDDTAALRGAVSGMGAVIHLAAHVHQRSIPADGSPEASRFRAVNVEGTHHGTRCRGSRRDSRFVLASSVKVMGEKSHTPFTEDVAPAPADAYGLTKLEAEQMVRDAAARHGFHAPVLRFPLVYGPGMQANALRLFDAVVRRTPLPLGSVQNRRSFLFTGNMAAAILATLESRAGDDIFFVSNGHDLSTPDFVHEIGRALGRAPCLIPVPVGLLRFAGRIGDATAGISPLTATVIDRLVGSLAFDISKLKRLTGYRMPYPVHEGVRITAEWYLHDREPT